MSRRTVVVLTALLVPAFPSTGLTQTWNSPGMSQEQFDAVPEGGPAPLRDLTGIWDASGRGIGGSGQAPGRAAAQTPFTPLGQEMMDRNKPGNGPRRAPVSEINDPLSTIGDPSGFPRQLNFELRPFQVVHTPNQVLMLYMFEKRWRVIWTDGRALPEDPDPRWYAYSVGHWEDDYTFVVDSVGTDDRTWLDNSGNPHSTSLRVREVYRRISENVLELTVTLDDPLVYTGPWISRDHMRFKRLPADTDLMEMIPSASEAQEYRKVISSQTR